MQYVVHDIQTSQFNILYVAVLEEIWRCIATGNHSLDVGYSVKQFGFLRVGVTERQHRSDVTAAVAIVRRRPHRHKLLVKHVLVT